MNAKPMLNVDAIVFILCTGFVLLAVAFGAGYMWGVDHADSQHKLKRIREPVPCNCVNGLDERDIRNAVYRSCKKVGKT